MLPDRREGIRAARHLAAGATPHEALDTGDPDAWIALDEGTRADHWYADPDWERSDGGRALIAALRAGATLTDGQLALALCHRDGRVRHRALGRAAGRPALLPLVVLRCADWAAPVRDRARERLTDALDEEMAVRLAPLVLRLGRRGRGDFAADRVGELLAGASAGVLAPLLTGADRGVRRYAYGIATGRGLLSPVELARAAAHDEDAVIQSRSADAALAAVTEEDAEAVLAVLLGARGPRARSAGVTALRRLGRPRRAVPFLADRSALVRACARYVVRQHGTDPLPWYRDRCADPADPALPPGAALGLGECGQRADAALLWPLLEHPAPAVRAKAVAGLRALDVTDVPRMRRLLDDPAPGVVREATLALAASADALPADWLLERLDTGRPRWVRASAARLIGAHEAAVRMRAARVLLGDPDDRLRARAEQAVQRLRGRG
ncbi:HEAT repeat domain-containing protein [Streptomyces sp. NPDC047028]|uniref:HEAT repeat domain-containing protein n=1 Tax=Streptomyces sp. NPDC047028 TaxID=3155793 RepID=UPI0034117C90